MIARDVKVGAFVLGALLMLGGVIFLIGSEAQLFAGHRDVVAKFKNVQGLSRGSVVRMGGVDIGRVVDVRYASDANDDTIFVKMSVVESEARRIRTDSVASVEGKGLLGDKMIEITVGSDASPALPLEQPVRTSESKDLAEIVNDLKAAAAGAERVIQNLEVTTKSFADETFHEDVKKSVAHVESILGSMERGDGYIGRLLHDQAEAERLSATVEALRRSGGELEQLLAGLNRVVRRVETGPGFAHELLYEAGGTKAIAQIGVAAEEVGLAVKGLREGSSLAHEVLYGKDSGQIVNNLNQTTADMRDVVRGIKDGKGTMGALLVDPSLYEDMKVLLGNVGRNRTLRALVRYSIARDESVGRAGPVETSGSGEKSED